MLRGRNKERGREDKLVEKVRERKVEKKMQK